MNILKSLGASEHLINEAEDKLTKFYGKNEIPPMILHTVIYERHWMKPSVLKETAWFCTADGNRFVCDNNLYYFKNA